MMSGKRRRRTNIIFNIEFRGECTSLREGLTLSSTRTAMAGAGPPGCQIKDLEAVENLRLSLTKYVLTRYRVLSKYFGWR